MMDDIRARQLEQTGRRPDSRESPRGTTDDIRDGATGEGKAPGQPGLRGKGCMVGKTPEGSLDSRERQCGTGATDDIRTIQLHVGQ